MPRRAADFESAASASSATRPWCLVYHTSTREHATGVMGVDQFEKAKNAAVTALVYIARILDVTLGAQAGVPVPLSN
jgi:hypothetical protein